MSIWNHPELGDFKFDYTGWTKQYDLPAFKPFIYRWHGRNVGRSKIKLEFEAEDGTEFPSKQAVTVALRIIKNQDVLAKRIAKAVWNDLQGSGEASGMWWHGDISTINEMIDAGFKDRKRKPFEKPDDINLLIGAPSVMIRESIWLYEKPSATIMFEAAFDIEHGLGVLTDGHRILGTGYQTSVTPYFNTLRNKSAKNVDDNRSNRVVRGFLDVQRAYKSKLPPQAARLGCSCSLFADAFCCTCIGMPRCSLIRRIARRLDAHRCDCGLLWNTDDCVLVNYDIPVSRHGALPSLPG